MRIECASDEVNRKHTENRHQTIRFQIAHWKGFPPDIKKRQKISLSLFIVWRIAGVNKIGLRIDGTGYEEKLRTTGSLSVRIQEGFAGWYEPRITGRQES